METTNRFVSTVIVVLLYLNDGKDDRCLLQFEAMQIISVQITSH